mgnify:CR=1 FL=1
MTERRYPFAFLWVDLALTVGFVALGSYLAGLQIDVRRLQFASSMLWLFGIMASTLLFVWRRRVRERRGFVQTAAASTAMAMVVPAGWTTVFHIPGDPLSFILFWNALAPAASTAVYCIGLAAFPRRPRAHAILASLWSLSFAAGMIAIVYLKWYCCGID